MSHAVVGDQTLFPILVCQTVKLWSSSISPRLSGCTDSDISGRCVHPRASGDITASSFERFYFYLHACRTQGRNWGAAHGLSPEGPE